MRRLLTFVVALSLPIVAKIPLQGTVVVTTEHVDAGATSTVTIDHSVGELDIQGWDQPQVEVTATKSVFRETKDEALRDLEKVHVKLANKDGGAEVTTVLPERNFFVRPFKARTDVVVQTVIRVPRGAHVVVRHESGDVRLRDVSGAIDASVHAGDLQLWMSDAKSYRIDAKCKVGGISSDFEGKFHDRFPAGDAFADASAASAPEARLRVGIGGIQVLRAK